MQNPNGRTRRGCVLGCASFSLPLSVPQSDTHLPALRDGGPEYSISPSGWARVLFSLAWIEGGGEEQNKIYIFLSSRNPERNNEVYKRIDVGF